jgi:hypothetical protein
MASISLVCIAVPIRWPERNQKRNKKEGKSTNRKVNVETPIGINPSESYGRLHCFPQLTIAYAMNEIRSNEHANEGMDSHTHQET